TSHYYLVYIFFFFQAEDGIRDRNVTGVQTCALPICHFRCNHCIKTFRHLAVWRKVFMQWLHLKWLKRANQVTPFSFICMICVKRSEERRVGKECRSRWARYDEEKKEEAARQESIAER